MFYPHEPSNCDTFELKVGSLAQKLTVLGKPLFSVQLALFSAKCPKLRIFHTTGSCLGDNSEPESINRNYIYLTSGLSAGFSRTIGASQNIGHFSESHKIAIILQF